MSHYQDNINAPHFPPGVHMSHFSLTNTTLIGQEVQQRLWEKYWGQQYPVPSPPYMWPYPGAYSVPGYPYGVSNNFSSSVVSSGFEQTFHPMTLQVGESIHSVNHYRGEKPCLESYSERDFRVEVLDEGNSWTTKKQETTAKQQKSGNPLVPKIVDPVTDDLDWNSFSANLADGIVVSILDSFVVELPVLDVSMVRSVLEEIAKLSPPEDQVQRSTGKKQYFQDIVSLTKTQTQESTDKSLPQPEGKEGKGLQDTAQSNHRGKSIDDALEHIFSSAMPREDEKELFQDNGGLIQTQLYHRESKSLTQHKEIRQSTDEALEHTETSLADTDEAKDELKAISQTLSSSSVWNTTGNKTKEDEFENSPDERFTTSTKSNRTGKAKENEKQSSVLPITSSVNNESNTASKTVQKEENSPDVQVPNTRTSTRAGKTTHDKEYNYDFILNSISKSNTPGKSVQDEEGNSSGKGQAPTLNHTQSRKGSATYN